jgi:hypothetical protein
VRRLLATLLIAALSSVANAQTVDPFDAVAAAVLRMLRDQQSGRQGAAEPTGVDALAAAVDQLPQTGPLGKQVTAPSIADVGTVSDAASFPELFGLALDSNLVQFGEGAMTLDLNLFGFRTLFDPDVLDRQTRYGSRRNSLLRRFGGALTFGGRGDAQAESPFDNVTWEVRVRAVGSRDRRDQVNFRKYEEAVLAPDSDLGRAIGDFIRAHVTDISGMLVNNVLDASKLNAFLKTPRIVQELAALVPLLDDFVRAHASVTRSIDRAPVWTVVAGGTQRKSSFGPNTVTLGLRGVAGSGPIDHTWNVNWLQVDGLTGFPDATTWKAAYSASGLVLQGTPLTEAGVEIAVSAAAEHYRNVPGARHPTVIKAGATLEIPIGRGMKLPASINYANHRDLLTDQNEVIGHIGLAIDLSELRKKRS